MGLNLKSIHAEYGFKKCSIRNLDSLYLDKRFIPFSKETMEGVFLFSPVFDVQKERVVTLSFLFVAYDYKRLEQIKQTFFWILNEHTELGN